MRVWQGVARGFATERDARPYAMSVVSCMRTGGGMDTYPRYASETDPSYRPDVWSGPDGDRFLANSIGIALGNVPGSPPETDLSQVGPADRHLPDPQEPSLVGRGLRWVPVGCGVSVGPNLPSRASEQHRCNISGINTLVLPGEICRLLATKESARRRRPVIATGSLVWAPPPQPPTLCGLPQTSQALGGQL